MCVCDKYGLRSRIVNGGELLELYCPVCGYSEIVPVKQPTLEQLVGREKAAEIRAARSQPVIIREYRVGNRIIGRAK